MEKIVIFLIILVSIIKLNGFNFIGENGKPTNPLFFENNEMYENYIENKLQTQDEMFEELDIANLIREIDNYNILIKNKDLDLKKQIGVIYTDKKIISEHLDLDDIRNQIETKGNSINDIKSDVKKELENIKYKGIFLAVHKFENTYEKKEILSKISENNITPKAIEDLNGIFINSYTEIKNHITVSDVIVGISKGKVSIEESYIKETYHKDKLYIYLAKVIVSPLNEELNEVKNSDNYFNGQIFNLEKGDNWEKNITEMGVKSKVITKIKNIMRNKLEVIKTENLTEIRREEEIIRAGINRVSKINKDIQILKEKILKKEKEINKIAKKYGIEINNFQISNIKSIIKKIENQIDYFTEFRYKVKEKELIQQTTTLTAEGDPKSEIAKKVTALTEQIAQTYEKKDLQFKKDEVENFMQKSSISKGKIKIFRKIDNLWLYVVPKDDADRFSVTVVTNFTIDIKNDHQITDEEINSSIISLSDNYTKNNSLDRKEYKKYTERIVINDENKISSTNESSDSFPIVTEKKIEQEQKISFIVQIKKIISVQNIKILVKKIYFFIENNLVFIIPLLMILLIYDNVIRKKETYSDLRAFIIGIITLCYGIILFYITIIPKYYNSINTETGSIYYWINIFLLFISIFFYNELKKMLNKKHNYFKTNKYITFFIYNIILIVGLIIYSDFTSLDTNLKSISDNVAIFIGLLFLGLIVIYIITNLLYSFSIRKLNRYGFRFFKTYSNIVLLSLLGVIIIGFLTMTQQLESIDSANSIVAILEMALSIIEAIGFVFLSLLFFDSLKAEKQYQKYIEKYNVPISELKIKQTSPKLITFLEWTFTLLIIISMKLYFKTEYENIAIAIFISTFFGFIITAILKSDEIITLESTVEDNIVNQDQSESLK